jgi:hypothetical protein
MIADVLNPTLVGLQAFERQLSMRGHYFQQLQHLPGIGYTAAILADVDFDEDIDTAAVLGSRHR